MAEAPRSVFNNALAYEAYMGRWSRLVAPQFVRWLNAGPDLAWLDVGAGTGVLTQSILDVSSPRRICALDPSTTYLEYAQNTFADSRVTFEVGDTRSAMLEPHSFDVAVAGLVLNFMPSAEDGVRAMVDAVVPGGVVAAYVWDYTEGMGMLRQFWSAAASIDPTSAALESGGQYAICHPEPLQALFERLGLLDVQVVGLEIPQHFRDFDDYWQPFLVAQGSVAKFLHSLAEDKLIQLREQLRQQLTTNEDGSIDLTARAWAVRGRR